MLRGWRARATNELSGNLLGATADSLVTRSFLGLLIIRHFTHTYTRAYLTKIVTLFRIRPTLLRIVGAVADNTALAGAIACTSTTYVNSQATASGAISLLADGDGNFSSGATNQLHAVSRV